MVPTAWGRPAGRRPPLSRGSWPGRSPRDGLSFLRTGAEGGVLAAVNAGDRPEPIGRPAAQDWMTRGGPGQGGADAPARDRLDDAPKEAT